MGQNLFSPPFPRIHNSIRPAIQTVPLESLKWQKFSFFFWFNQSNNTNDDTTVMRCKICDRIALICFQFIRLQINKRTMVHFLFFSFSEYFNQDHSSLNFIHETIKYMKYGYKFCIKFFGPWCYKEKYQQWFFLYL